MNNTIIIIFTSTGSLYYYYCVAVRYQLSEDPKLLKSTEVPEVSKAHSTRISLSPDARVVAVSVDKEETSSIYVYPTASDAERISMIDIHRGTVC